MGRPTAKRPRLDASEWRGWLAIAALAFTPPGMGTFYVGSKVSENTAAIQELRLAMEAGKVTTARCTYLESRVKDHEVRIRDLEKAQ